MEESKHIEI